MASSPRLEPPGLLLQLPKNASSGPAATHIRTCPAQPELSALAFAATQMPSLPPPKPQNSLSGPATASKSSPSPARASTATCSSPTRSSDQLSPAPQKQNPRPNRPRSVSYPVNRGPPSMFNTTAKMARKYASNMQIICRSRKSEEMKLYSAGAVRG